MAAPPDGVTGRNREWCHNGTHYLNGRGTVPPAGMLMWATRETNAGGGPASAVAYVLVVLLLYALALGVVLVKYVRRERYEARLYHLYDEFMRRDRFLRLSKRHSSVKSEEAPVGDPAEPREDDSNV